MADVIHRATCEYRRSVSTPDYPSVEWLHNPNLSAVAGVLRKYWKVVGETVQEMDATEKAAVDQGEADQTALIDRTEAKADVERRLMRALVEIIMDELNILRAEHGLPARTLPQVKTAIKNKIDGI